MFIEDKAITKASDDLLGRWNFTKNLVDYVIRFKEKNSIIIGLSGGWGVGKTSIINLALEAFEKYNYQEKLQKPILINFNPLNCSFNNLTYEFFSHISFKLKAADSSDLLINGDKILKLLSLETQRSLNRPLSFEKEENSLSHIKEKLNLFFNEQKKKIIITIDDIDLLPPNKIYEIFQLIKNKANFPNTAYIITFKYDTLKSTFEEIKPGQGKELIEKMIQVPFVIPQILQEDINKILISQINEIIKDTSKELIDEFNFLKMYLGGFKDFFKTLRDVKRYINHIKFAYPLIKDELNTADFLVISGIQVFLPNLYDKIYQNKRIFSEYEIISEFNSINAGLYKKRYKEIIENLIIMTTPEKYYQIVKETLIDMFHVNLKPIFDERNISHSGDYLEQQRKNHRICCPKYFNCYFRLSLDKDMLPKTKMKEILKSSSDFISLKENIKKMSQNKQIYYFLTFIKDQIQTKTLNKETIENLITIFFVLGDTFPKSKKDFPFYSPIVTTSILCLKILETIKEPSVRYEIIKKSLKHPESHITILIKTINFLTEEEGSQLCANFLPKEAIKDLKNILIEKIRSLYNKDKILNQKFLFPSLRFWKKHENEDFFKEKISLMLKTNQNLITFITKMSMELFTESIDSRFGIIRKIVDFKTIEQYFDIKKYDERFKKLKASPYFNTLKPNEKKALNLFIERCRGNLDEFGYPY